MEEVIQETGVHTVLIAAPGLPQDDLSSLIYRAQSLVKQVDVIPNLVAVPMSNVTAESFFDAKIMVLHIRNNLASPWNQLLKRIFDIVATICGGILISPILLAIAIWVYHDSPGPVIFKHRRVGKNGKEFNCYKFRSMCVNSKEVLEHLLATDPAAKAEWDKEFKLKDDPRITKSGAFLRKTSLDELPQLWNVLKGEMSLVGPGLSCRRKFLDMGNILRNTIPFFLALRECGRQAVEAISPIRNGYRWIIGTSTTGTCGWILFSCGER